jgi:hypothetical protein
MEERKNTGEGSDGQPRAPEGDGNEKRPAALKGRLSRGERLVILAGITLLVLAGVYVVRSRFGVRNQREALLAKSAAEAASLSRREAEILDILRGFIFETAAAEAPGDVTHRELSAPGALDAFLARPGLYFRAAQPDVRPRFLADAVRSTPKDAFALCLLAPPETLSDYDLTVTVGRALPGTPAFEEATRRIQRLDTVQRGLRVLTPGWLDEVRAADPIGLRALEGEYNARTAEEIKAAKAWAAAAYAAIVIDELPAGMKDVEGGTDLAESFRASMLSATKEKPHEVRVAIYDIEAKKPVLRRRIRMDAEAFKARTGFAEAAAAQDCYLGATARKHAQQI